MRQKIFRGGLLGVLLVAIAFSINPLPIPQSIKKLEQQQSTKLLDRNGALIRESLASEGGRRQWLSLDEIAPSFLDLLLSTEDSRFWSHCGIDPLALVRSIYQALNSGHIQSGASTITMQLVRMAYPRPRVFKSKIIEALTALWLEMSLSKKEIFELYINHLPLGNELYGVSSAAEVYFDKHARDLNIEESAYLVALIRSPTTLNPYLNRSALDRVARSVLTGFHGQKNLTLDDLKNVRFGRRKVLFEAPHFSDFVLRQNNQSKVVNTSLNLNLNREIESIIRERLVELEDKNVFQAAALVVENDTGEILAYVGSEDYWNNAYQGMVDGVQQFRQPGSTLKPFNYTLALEEGVPAYSTLADIPTSYSSNIGSYSPENYDHRYRGPIMLRKALANSLNIPAVELLQQVGLVDFYSKLKKLGFSALKERPEYYGLGLTLGNAEVSLYELVQAYSVFAHDGKLCPLTWKRTESNRCEKISKEIYKGDAIIQVRDFLMDHKARRQAFGNYSPLDYDFPVMVKTGTSQQHRDNWVMAVTPKYTVGVWVGNFNGDMMNGVSGVTGAGPISNAIVNHLYQRTPWNKFQSQDKLKKRDVCALSGFKPRAHCPVVHKEYVLDSEHQGECQIHKVIDYDVRNGLLAGASCEEQYVRSKIVWNLEGRFLKWQLENYPDTVMPHRASSLCSDKGRGIAVLSRGSDQIILSPERGAEYKIDWHRPKAAQTLNLALSPDFEDGKILYDNDVIIKGSEIPLEVGQHTIQAFNSLGQLVDTVRYRVVH